MDPLSHNATQTDMFDGYVARRTGAESELGAKPDSIEDLMLVVVCLVKLLPAIIADAITTFVAVQEGHFIRTCKAESDVHVKMIGPYTNKTTRAVN